MNLTFHTELFEHRWIASERLAQHGFEWLADYTTIDLLHEEFGLGVGGIRDESAACRMVAILQAMFPTWRYLSVFEKDWGDRDLGWWIEIHRDPERQTGLYG